MDVVIRPAEERDYPDILRMNQADVELLSPMNGNDLIRMRNLTEMFQVAEIDGKITAFQMVYRENTGYWSENYAWFCAHYPRFLYVDRIVVDHSYRQFGLGRRLYHEVLHRAVLLDVPIIAAEIDIAPKYNAASMEFHKKMGFQEVGTRLFRGNITVSLQTLELSKIMVSSFSL